MTKPDALRLFKGVFDQLLEVSVLCSVRPLRRISFGPRTGLESGQTTPFYDRTLLDAVGERPTEPIATANASKCLPLSASTYT